MAKTKSKGKWQLGSHEEAVAATGEVNEREESLATSKSIVCVCEYLKIVEWCCGGEWKEAPIGSKFVGEKIDVWSSVQCSEVS
ncbi:hypothetical protein ColTof3_04698 [Colletotrichum tofieldiae]|nr:hypothetical protein ColTof3_04698 [Colletotrichum tofieldiae]